MATTPHAEQQRPLSESFLKNKDIVVISMSDWEGPKRIRQYLSEELARSGNRVLFVESQYTLSKFLKKPSLSKAFRFLRGPRRLLENLFLLATVPFIPGGEFSSFIARVNWNLERTFIRAATKKLGFHDPILWLFAYNAHPLIGKMGESCALYFCNDAFSLLVESKSLQQRVATMEQDLLKLVDVVFTVSEPLSEEKARFHSSVHTVHHGVDLKAFENPAARQRPPDVPSATPIIGYSGVIRYMIDLDLIAFIADQQPQWSIVLVGPVAESGAEFYSRIEQLKQRPNIHFLGSKRPEDLPAYISTFNVCLLPYVQGEISRYYAAPLKFYEYLAAGKPVVSTVGPRNDDREVVINCTNKEDVLAAIHEALAQNPAAAEKRRAIAASNSWAQRLHQIDKVLSQLPKRK